MPEWYWAVGALWGVVCFAVFFVATIDWAITHGITESRSSAQIALAALATAPLAVVFWPVLIVFLLLWLLVAMGKDAF